ncbi:hypothetical protein BCR35DRAFT_317396 [Leucosporidium creatinivorum]|uniref:AMP binding protein n=1 Tax=Leucosporidium creatinivorum TaxID=106004 RepID=A0A1Y2FYF0_9BASI|nr:hypothetical protein BCR35DRAFT_317396 [Leucosporidium creatinivorum]
MTIYTSHFPPVQQWSNLGVFDFLFTKNPNLKPNNVALIDANTGEKTTYQQLITTSLSYASGLSTRANLKPGSVILLFSPNSTLYPSLLFAGQAAGLTVSTANSSYTPSELSHQIEVSGAEVLLVGSDLVDVAREAAKERGVKEDRIYVLPGVDGKVVVPAGLRSYTELNDSVGGKSFKPVQLTEEETLTRVAYLPFSSGTTGKGKGVAISAANITAVSQQLNEVKGLFDGPEVVMGVLPLYHIYGLIVLLHQTLLNGGTVVLMPKFDLPQFCSSVQSHKATVALIVPPIALGIAKHPIVDEYDLSSLRFMMSGAAPLSESLQKAVTERLGRKGGKTLMLQGWGMTVGLLPDLHDYAPGTCGKLLTSMEARLVDADGKDVKEGEAGELWVRGRNIMIGYHKNKKATDETIHKEGWLMTGDVCVRSKAGHFTIVDRTKELIKYKGFQVPPAELEGVLLTCPLVADCAVIGVWSEAQATELPRAYVVPEAAHAKDQKLEEKIIAFVQSKVAPHKRLRGGVVLIEVIPKSPSGKILRKDLRAVAAKNDDKASARL